MPQISITQLPQAQALTGFESVPIVQNGVTVQTTTAQIAGTPNLGYSFLTATSEPALAQSRYLTVGSGLSVTDNGAGSTLQVNLTGAANSLNSSPVGIQVKTGSGTLTGRSVAVGAGLSVSNPSGVGGDPTISLGTLLSGLASQTGTGILALQSGSIAKVSILGTASQISVSNGDGATDVTVGISSNPVLPGAGSVVVPVGSTAQRVTSTGAIRYNTDFQQFEGYTNTGWNQFSVAGGVTSFSGGSTGLLPNTATTGAVTLSGTLVPASGGTGATTLTGYVYGNGTATMTASPTIPTANLSGTISNAQLANSSLTINGTSISLGGSATISSSTTNTLTIGTGLSGGSFNGSTPVTIAINSTVATLTGSQTLTNKSISGSTNTLTNIPNSALTNSSVTFNSTTVALGGSGTITAVNPNALTIGTGLQLNAGTTYDGSAAKTISIDSSVVTLTGSQTLTNKTLTTPVIAQISNTGVLTLPSSTDTLVGRATTDTLTNKSISGSTNTLTNIPNSALTNSSITLGTTNIALGGTSLAPAGLTSVTVTQDPSTAFQLATKQYVDGLVSTGLYYHQPVQAATTQSLATQTGGTVTYNNGASGVGATLTLSVALTTLDGYSLVNGDRILVKNETNQTYNGVYTWATGGTVLTRSTDADSYGTGTGDLSENDYFFVQNGNVNKGTSYVCTTAGTITFGTTAITFAQFSTSQVYTAGTGLTLTNTTFSISNTAVTAASYGSASAVGTFTVNAQGQLTAAATTPIAISNTQVSGLGTMSTQNANNVAITGGAIDGTTIGGTTAAAATFTTLTATGQTLLGGASGSQNVQINTVTTSGAYTLFDRNNASNIQLIGAANTSNLGIYSTGGGEIRFYTASALAERQLTVSRTVSAVNYWNTTGSITGNAIPLQAAGSDANISQVFQPKGTGAIDLAPGSSGVNISNGGTVTAVTLSAAGTGYTSFPTATISVPTTAGGVQAVVSFPRMYPSGVTVQSGGTGYTVGDVLTVSGGTPVTTAATLTVSTVSGGVITAVTVTAANSYTVLPSNPVSVTGGTGSGATFNLTYSLGAVTTISNAGSGYVEQPTVSFSGGGGSGATAYATVGSDTVIRSLGTNLQFYSPNQQIAFRTIGLSGGTNVGYWSALGGTTGPQLRATGSGSGVILTESAVPIQFQTASLEQFRIAHTASAVNYVQVTGSATSPGASSLSNIIFTGSDSSVSGVIATKGTSGYIAFSCNSSTNTQAFRVTMANASNTGNLINVQGALAGSAPSIQAIAGPSGTDTNIDLSLQPKGTGGTNISNNQANYVKITGGAAGFVTQEQALGSDTNISMAFQPKGTGAIDLAAGSGGVNISNGGTVTSVVRTSAGTGYTSLPSIAITAPTTAGGVQAVLAVTLQIVNYAIAVAGSGYVVGDTITLVGGTGTATTFTVASLSGSGVATLTTTNNGSYTVVPSNPVSTTTNGVGTGLTINMTWGVTTPTITTAGSGYVEQPTVSFSGGGGSSAAAYATVGGGATVRTLGGVLDFYTPNQQIAFRIADYSGSASTGYWTAYGGNTSPILRSVGSSQARIESASAVSIALITGSTASGGTQLVVANTASAVNYLQVTGATTGNSPALSSQGSDANVNLLLNPKGNSQLIVFINGGSQFRVSNTLNAVNYLQAVGNTAGLAPSFSAQGSDTNIDLTLTPKGTGKVVITNGIQGGSF